MPTLPERSRRHTSPATRAPPRFRQTRLEMALKIAHFPAVREFADFDFKA